MTEIAASRTAAEVGDVHPGKADTVKTTDAAPGRKCDAGNPWFIALPAWGEAYIDTALRYTVPSLLASASAAGIGRMRFCIHTSDLARFSEALEGHSVDFLPIPDGPHPFARFETAHREGLAAAPEGSNVCLINADMPMSLESFGFAEGAFAAGKSAIVSTGIRSLIGATPPPIGATARDLLAWCWANRHPISEDCVWGRGKMSPPTTLFFEYGGNVVMHCFHLHPIFLRKNRRISFNGTIDDDLLANFEEGEIHFVADREMALAELSPPEKRFRSVHPLSVGRIVAWFDNINATHWRNFSKAFTILGDPALVDTTPAMEVLKGLEAARNRPRERRRVFVTRRRLPLRQHA